MLPPLGAAELPLGIPWRPPSRPELDCPPMPVRPPRTDVPPMPDWPTPPDIEPAFDGVLGPVRLPKPGIPVDPPLIPARPLIPDALEDGPPAMPPIPDDASWEPGTPPMPDIPERTPSPATPSGRVAGVPDIPLLPPIEPMSGRGAGTPGPVPDGLEVRGAPGDRSPMPPIPPCCAQAGMATAARAKLSRSAFVQSWNVRMLASPTCPRVWSPRCAP